MFVLKETENSDARCGCVTSNSPDIKTAQTHMKELYEKTIHLLGGVFEDHESEALDAEEQRWANITPTSAHIQAGLDAFDWEIAEDPNWVSKDDCPQGFIVVGCTTSNHNGDLIPAVPIFAKTEEEAKAILEKLYRKELDNLGLPDNNACDENDESCPGGCLEGTSADIWDYTEYTFNCLTNVAHFSYFPLVSQNMEVAYGHR